MHQPCAFSLDCVMNFLSLEEFLFAWFVFLYSCVCMCNEIDSWIFCNSKQTNKTLSGFRSKSAVEHSCILLWLLAELYNNLGREVWRECSSECENTPAGLAQSLAGLVCYWEWPKQMPRQEYKDKGVYLLLSLGTFFFCFVAGGLSEADMVLDLQVTTGLLWAYKLPGSKQFSVKDFLYLN